MMWGKPLSLLRVLLIAYALVLSIEGGANVWINFIGKGRTWDLYPLAQAFWVACSVIVVIVLARRPSMKRLAAVVIVLMFLDSFVDACAMGNPCWWAGPPVLIEWQWDALRARGALYPHLYAYWAVTWGMQVPLRCFAIAWVSCGGSWKRFALIAAGLNLIWLTAPQDFLYFFVWVGHYDASYPYFDYLPPRGCGTCGTCCCCGCPSAWARGVCLCGAECATHLSPPTKAATTSQ